MPPSVSARAGLSFRVLPTVRPSSRRQSCTHVPKTRTARPCSAVPFSCTSSMKRISPLSTGAMLSAASALRATLRGRHESGSRRRPPDGLGDAWGSPIHKQTMVPTRQSRRTRNKYSVTLERERKQVHRHSLHAAFVRLAFRAGAADAFRGFAPALRVKTKLVSVDASSSNDHSPSVPVKSFNPSGCFIRFNIM